MSNFKKDEILVWSPQEGDSLICKFKENGAYPGRATITVIDELCSIYSLVDIDTSGLKSIEYLTKNELFEIINTIATKNDLVVSRKWTKKVLIEQLINLSRFLFEVHDIKKEKPVFDNNPDRFKGGDILLHHGILPCVIVCKGNYQATCAFYKELDHCCRSDVPQTNSFCYSNLYSLNDVSHEQLFKAYKTYVKAPISDDILDYPVWLLQDKIKNFCDEIYQNYLNDNLERRSNSSLLQDQMNESSKEPEIDTADFLLAYQNSSDGNCVAVLASMYSMLNEDQKKKIMQLMD